MSVLKAALAAGVLATAPDLAQAQNQDEDLAARVRRLELLVESQQQQIEAQRAALQARAEPAGVQPGWRVQSAAELERLAARGAEPGPVSLPAEVAAPIDAAVPAVQPAQAPGAAPPALQPTRAQLAALPEGMSVLSRRGRLTFDVSGDYTRSSANRLVFRGIEIVPGVQIGVIEANEADRDTLGVTAAGRFGVTDRLEVEARIPYLRRSDTITTVQQRDEAVTRTIALDGSGLGDIEAAVRYQINGGERGRPIFVAGLRVKSDTGDGPFDIGRDEFGVATRLATGSGFWGVEPSVSMLYASDPAVIFANLGYFVHLARDVGVTEGDVRIGRVDPGDSIGAAIGFGFALNPNFSYSLGYKHNYIFATETQLNDIVEKSDELQVGVLLFGLSYRFNDRFSLNGNFEFGVTEDAPDMRFILRVPLSF